MKLHIKSFAITMGLLWGIVFFKMTWWVIITDRFVWPMNKLGYLFPGYCVSELGSLIGFAWGFLSGLITGAVFAWFYNFLVDKFPPKAAA